MKTTTQTPKPALRPAISWQDSTATIDARGVYYRQLNEAVREAANEGAQRLVLKNICGHRYIGDGLRKNFTIEIEGVPGNDLAMFMDGPTIVVRGNTQDGVANTMTSGRVIVHGSAGDLLAHSLRGGEIYVRGSAGYRVAIHMKQFTEPVPVVVIGGCVGDYAGEYMAGGALVVLGLDRSNGTPLAGQYLGTGMHGGVMYMRGEITPVQMGKEISAVEMTDADHQRLATYVGRFADHFSVNAADILKDEFVKLVATSSRPYGRLYVY